MIDHRLLPRRATCPAPDHAGGEAPTTTVGGVEDNSRPQQRRAITIVGADQGVFLPPSRRQQATARERTHLPQ